MCPGILTRSGTLSAATSAQWTATTAGPMILCTTLAHTRYTTSSSRSLITGTFMATWISFPDQLLNRLTISQIRRGNCGVSWKVSPLGAQIKRAHSSGIFQDVQALQWTEVHREWCYGPRLQHQIKVLQIVSFPYLRPSYYNLSGQYMNTSQLTSCPFAINSLWDNWTSCAGYILIFTSRGNYGSLSAHCFYMIIIIISSYEPCDPV